MRTQLALLVSLVFVVCTGACAGRQRPQSGLRSELHQPLAAPDPKVQSVPIDTEIVVPEAPHAAASVAAVAVPKKIVPKRIKRVRSAQEQINFDVRQIINANNAWLRAVGERVYGTRVPPSLPMNDELVAALRIEPNTVERPRRYVAKAPRASVKHAKPPIPSVTHVVYSAARTRSLTPLPPKVQERANVAALAALESPDPTTLGVVSSAPPATTEATSSVVHMSNMSARRSDVALTDPKSSSIDVVDRPHLFEPSASVSASSPFYQLYLPAIIFAVILGPLLGYILSRRPTRVSSFDDDVVRDATSTVVTDPAPTHVLALAHVVPHSAPTQEARPPHQFPEGSGQIIRSEDLNTGQIAAGEIEDKNLDAPTQAPPTNTIYLN
ncbi:MAG: hypothetical protein WC866_01010 [Patescibacteria group bacterium]|jgi:hypothetical protein